MNMHTKQKKSQILLGVNIDHVATLRNARGTRYPEPIEAVFAAEGAGADGITVHLREDRRHIKERDVELIQKILLTRLNLELAVTDAMVAYAESIKPEHCCFVPESRHELTTEGGLNVIEHHKKVAEATARLQASGIQVSLFIDPDFAQIDAAANIGAEAIEIHTGAYADAETFDIRARELARIVDAAHHAAKAGLVVNAGHGLNVQNVSPIAAIPEINELNIGHAIIARSLFIGLGAACIEMKKLMLEARQL